MSFMSSTNVTPDAVASAASRLESLGASITGANTAAAAVTTQLIPAAEDEISAAIAGLFNTCAQDFRGLAAQAAAFHDGFVQTLYSSAESYVAAEASSAAALVGSGGPTAAQVIQLYGNGPIPENAFPYGSLKQQSFTQSVTEGLQILDIQAQQALAVPGNTISIYGYSQSAVVVSLEMANLQAHGVPTSNASFFIVGNPMNPNGGFYERFAGLQLPSLGMNFYGATPSNAYPTKIYTIEYDSVADYPRYPIDIFSDLNAALSTNHFYYHVLTQQQINSAVPLPTSGPTQTQYYMIPSPDLPLAAAFRGIPFIGNPIADLLEPDLTYLVNLGYGDPLYGWSTGPANVPTQAGLLPPLSAFQEMPGLLASGTQLGIHNFIGDFTGTGPNPVTVPSLSSIISLLEHPQTLLNSLIGNSGANNILNGLLGASSASGASTGAAAGLSSIMSASPATLGPALATTALSTLAAVPVTLGNTITEVANVVSNLAADVYSIGYITADVLNAALISIPSYDLNLFLDGLLQAFNGQPVEGLINAIGQPIASDVGLYPWLLNLWVGAVTNPSEAAGPQSGIASIGIG
jgi:hypothetical protein